MAESSPLSPFGTPPSRATTASALRVVHTHAATAQEPLAADGLTLSQIASRAGISRPSAEEGIAELIETGLVVETTSDPDAPRPVGRPAKRYRFRSEHGYVLGVDIGIHKVLALCADLSGHVLGSHRIEVRADLGNDERVKAARTALKRAARASSLRLSQVVAIGIGTTGPIDPGATIVSQSPALPQWAGVNLRQALSGISAGPVLADNDANLGALAERWRGAASDSADIVYILAGHQISVGILIDGHVRRGRHGAAGEIGQLRAAGWYQARDSLAAGRPVDDPRFIHDLATGIAATVLTIDPDKIVIGGGLSNAGDKLLKPLRRRLHDLCMFPIPVESSHLGEQNVALGALRLALEDVEGRLFTTPSRT
ncbi:ROK family protein [Streptomyces sp. NPDC051976]|uniref:ROK family transcriptional regulator n=1 Tax=Streptomyces sp. NPDC051976 TaxID=3154947 RepID=UPI0034123662